MRVESCRLPRRKILNRKLDFIGFLESLWRNPKALYFCLKVHVDENNIEMSTSRLLVSSFDFGLVYIQYICIEIEMI